MNKVIDLKKQHKNTGNCQGSVPQEAPITVVDVGCRWGFAELFLSEECQKSFQIFGFDPDEVECARLQKLYDYLPQGYVTCVPSGLAGSVGVRNLYVTKEPACSSLYPPNQYLAQNYPALDGITLQKVLPISVTTLDTWSVQNNVKAIDYLKLDTQGSELEIIYGANKILDTVRCIDLEVEFNPIYEGQSLFCETDAYLRSRGFMLWRLSNLVHYSLGGRLTQLSEKSSVCFDTNVRQEHDAFGGQLFWADARYIHRDVFLNRGVESHRVQRDLKLFNTLNMVDVVASMNCGSS